MKLLAKERYPSSRKNAWDILDCYAVYLDSEQ